MTIILAHVSKIVIDMFSRRCHALGLDLAISRAIALQTYRNQPALVAEMPPTDKFISFLSQPKERIEIPTSSLDAFVDWRRRFESDSAIESWHVTRALESWLNLSASAARLLDERTRCGLPL